MVATTGSFEGAVIRIFEAKWAAGQPFRDAEREERMKKLREELKQKGRSG